MGIGASGKKEGKTRLLNIVMQLRKCCNHPYRKSSLITMFGPANSTLVFDGAVCPDSRLADAR
jgi:SNF2 family DNA or RNA helicase